MQDVSPLPVDLVLPQVVDAVRSGNVVVSAPPGSGKTTRVPPALRAALPGVIVVLEPRRIATRMAAARVAAEVGVGLGAEVGYQVRFEARHGPDTRVLFVTEGVLTRRLLDDPDLRDVAAVVLDEFHERHLQADVALAWLRDLQTNRRPELRLVLMSATLDAAPLAEYLGGCPVVTASGRLYPVQIEYTADEPGRKLESRVAAAVRTALDQDAHGDILVFLPGAAEIRRAHDACASLVASRQSDIVNLHGDMPLDRQLQAVARGARRKVILSTNVAESSITVEGVTVVIDSGLARVASTSPWSGLTELNVAKVSRASAEQRAGRAGRLQAGRCIRLYSRHDFEHRRAFDTAEIHRVDLSEPVLALHGTGVADVHDLPWFEPPSQGAVLQAERLLERLGAIAHGGVTSVGRRMLALPLHPRLARLVVEGYARGIGQHACRAAALLSERDVRRGLRDSPHANIMAGPSDVHVMMRAYEDALDKRIEDRVDRAAVRRVQNVEKQLVRAAATLPGERRAGARERDAERALLISLLLAWPDRVARRRTRDGRVELLLAGGGTARLSDTSVMGQAEWIVCVDAEERGGQPLVRVASEIDPIWLLDFFVDRVTETDERVWNEKTQRVESVSRMQYERLVLDEARGAAPGDEETAKLLCEAALKAGVAAFCDEATIEGFLHRLAFVARVLPESTFPALGDEDVRDALCKLAHGATSFAELRSLSDKGGLLNVLESRLDARQRNLLQRAAPLFVQLSARRRVSVNYEAQQDPWIASRLQDFFGMREGPRVAEGRVSLVLHLLAPNQRPVQVTTDLAGFWARTYAGVRKELARRYPRHAWPVDPLNPQANG